MRVDLSAGAILFSALFRAHRLCDVASVDFPFFPIRSQLSRFSHKVGGIRNRLPYVSDYISGKI